MNHRLDLEKAAEKESFGALAVGRRQHRSDVDPGAVLTSAQKRAVAGLARSLLQLVRDAGAPENRLSLEDLSFELRQDGDAQILSIRKALSN